MFLRKPLTLTAPLGSLPRALTRHWKLLAGGGSAVALAALFAVALPRALALFWPALDTEVVLLFLPLSALIFAMVFEVMRMGVGNGREPGATEQHTQSWSPGRGEG